MTSVLIMAGLAHDKSSAPSSIYEGSMTRDLWIAMPAQGPNAKQLNVSLAEEVLRTGEGNEIDLLRVFGDSTNEEEAQVDIRISAAGNLVLAYSSGRIVEPVKFPSGKFRVHIGISDGLSLKISINDSTAYARAGVLQGLGVTGIEAIELPRMKLWSGVTASKIEVEPTHLGRSADAVTVFQWGVAFAIGLMVSVLVSLHLRRRSLPVTRHDLQIFILFSSITAGVMTVAAISAPIFNGTSPFIEPEHLNMNDWVDSVLVSSGEAYQFAHAAYPPGAYFTLSFLQSAPRTWYLLLAALSIGVMGGLVGSGTRLSNRWHGYLPGALLVLSLPTLFALDRGNIDLIVSAIFAIALVQFVRGNQIMAASLAGVAAGLKIYPFYQALVVRRSLGRRRATLIIIFILTTVILTMAAFSRGILNASNPGSTLSGFFTLYSADDSPFPDYNISAVPTVKWLSQALTSNMGLPPTLETLVRIGPTLLTTLSLVVIVLYIGARRLDPWRSQFLVALLVPLLSPVAFYYRLTLVIATLAILSAASERIRNPVFVGICTGTLLALPIGTKVFDKNLGSLIAVPICLSIILTLARTRRPVRE